MITLQQALGIGALLDGADSLLSSWNLTHPDLGRLTTRAEVVQATKTGTAEARNGVLRALVELAHCDVGDSNEAAALLCLLVSPGVVQKIRPLLSSRGSDDVNRVAASYLWLESKTFRLSVHHAVAASICWRVRTATFADFNVPADVARSDRTWANTRLVEDIEAVGPHVDRGVRTSGPESEMDLAGLLAEAEAAGVVTGANVALINTVLSVAEHHQDRGFRTIGLMSEVVSRESGRLLGIGASTVRRHARRGVLALRESVRCDACAFAEAG